jgi:hypothetical protein
MKTALVNGQKLTADQAAAKNETRASCPECNQIVRLHRKGKSGRPAAHFEHVSRSGPKCHLHYKR